MQIYGDEQSGNCLKVQYTADHLGLPYTWHPVDIMKNESRTAAFLRVNPHGQVPVIKLDDGRTLAQSNAIIRYLARDTQLLPTDAFEQAKVDEWLFWEQYSHEPCVAVCRFQMRYEHKPKGDREQWRVERGERALDTLEQHLNGNQWLAADAFSVADIALLAYTRLAHEGGFEMVTRPGVQRWIRACETELGLTGVQEK